jgi:hypothetical protein
MVRFRPNSVFERHIKQALENPERVIAEGFRLSRDADLIFRGGPITRGRQREPKLHGSHDILCSGKGRTAVAAPLRANSSRHECARLRQIRRAIRPLGIGRGPSAAPAERPLLPCKRTGNRHERMSPKCQTRKSPRSFDHFVGASEQHSRNAKAQRLGRLEVDDQFKLRGLLYRQIGGFSTFQNLVHVGRGAPKHISKVRPIGNKAPGVDKLPRCVHCVILMGCSLQSVAAHCSKSRCMLLLTAGSLVRIRPGEPMKPTVQARFGIPRCRTAPPHRDAIPCGIVREDSPA